MMTLTTTALMMTIGAFAIIRIISTVQALSSTVANTELVFEKIVRHSPQDLFASSEDYSAIIKEDIEFRDISFIYLSRDNRTVLHEVSFVYSAIKTTAIVKASDSGKSSIIGLIKRFYKPIADEICRWTFFSCCRYAQETIISIEFSD